MGLDEAISAVGQFGRWQILHYILIASTFGLPCAWQLFAIVFIGYINSHHCKVGANESEYDVIPIETGPDGFPRFSQCSRYNGTDNTTTIECPNGYYFYPEGFDEDRGTMVMEWDLVCDKDGYVELSLTMFNVGVVVGILLFTPLGDKFGRKTIFFVGQLCMNGFGIAMSFSPNFTAFCAFQFITGAFASGLYMEGGVLAVEMFPTDLRTFLAPVTPMFGSVGLALLALWAYLLRSWRQLQLGVSAFGCLSLLYFFWCPESLRWLMAQGRVKEVKRLLKQAAKMNGRTLPEGVLEKPSENQEEIDSAQEGGSLKQLKQLFTRRRPLRYMIIMVYLIFVNNIMYYGLSLMQGSLNGDFYTNFAINGILEVPALFCSIVAMAIYGRRYPLVFFQMFAAVFMALSAAATEFPDWEGIDNGMLVTGLALVSKFGVAGAYGVMVIYASEIVPTNVRSTCLGIQAGFGFVGSIAAPYVAVFLIRIKFWIPGAIFAVLAAVAAILTLFEPETIGRPLPTTVEEIERWTITLTKEEKIKRKEKSFMKMWKGVSNPGFVDDEGDDVKKEKENGVAVIGQEPANGKPPLYPEVMKGQEAVSEADIALSEDGDKVVHRF